MSPPSFWGYIVGGTRGAMADSDDKVYQSQLRKLGDKLTGDIRGAIEAQGDKSPEEFLSDLREQGSVGSGGSLVPRKDYERAVSDTMEEIERITDEHKRLHPRKDYDYDLLDLTFLSEH